MPVPLVVPDAFAVGEGGERCRHVEPRARPLERYDGADRRDRRRRDRDERAGLHDGLSFGLCIGAQRFGVAKALFSRIRRRASSRSGNGRSEPSAAFSSRSAASVLRCCV